MTDGLSRRDLVVLAGAGFAASACSPQKANLVEDCTAAIEAERGKQLLLASPGDPWGADPHDSPPTGGKNAYPAFAPNYIALLYLGLGRDWVIRVNQASYALGGKDPLGIALSVFKTLTKSSNRRFKDLENELGFPPYKRLKTNAGEVDTESFSHFKFASQTEIFIFIDHPVVDLDPALLISFGGLTQNGDQAAFNYSFFNAAPVKDEELGDLKGTGKMIRLRNYITKRHGEKITETNITYAMNIHFTVPGITADGKPAARMPMVFDPDTGNGTGHEP